MGLKWCTKLGVVQKRCPILFRGHPSNFKVTLTEKSMIWIQFLVKLPGWLQLSNPSDLPCLPDANFGFWILWSPASVCVCVYQSIACPHDNSSPVQARITQFGLQMKNTLVKIPIVFLFFCFFFFFLGGGGIEFELQGQLWLKKSKFIPFWACLHHNSAYVEARITKFGPNV